LGSGPRREADLASELGSEYDEPDLASARDRIRPLLDELQGLGLVFSRADGL